MKNILVLTQLYEENKKRIEDEFEDLCFTYSSRQTVTQELIDECDAIIGNPGDHVNINRENIHAILLNSAGSDSYVKEGVLYEGTLLANASGVHSTAMAEHTIGMILATNKHFRNYFAHMKNHQWIDVGEGKELFQSTVLIVGLGDIGYEIAKRLKGFQCHIIGIKRTMTSKPSCVDELYTIDSLKNVLPRADYVISCLPQTSETVHIFNRELFDCMKEKVTFVNIGRGSAVQLDDLKIFLKRHKFYAVCLDVMEQEPFYENDHLWDDECVFITPHVSGGYQWDTARKSFTELVIRNLHHLLENEPLENEVDFLTGYRKSVRYKE